MKIDYHFIAYVYDNECVVEYPDLMVIGTGQSFEEAFENANNNKKLYLDYLKANNYPIPKPKSFDQQEEVSGKVTLRMSKTTHKMAISRSQEENVSLNSYLNEAIIAYNFKKQESLAVKEILNIAINYNETYKNSLKDVTRSIPQNEGVKA